MSVAQQLGIAPQHGLPVPDARDTDELRRMTASRATREAAQVAAVQVQQAADQAAAQAAAAAAAEAARPKAVLPVNGAQITSGFGMRWGTLHAGVDFAAPLGTPEKAVMDGIVVKAGAASGFGQAVYIQHADGDVTVYGHMRRILVAVGEHVTAGQVIAEMGAEGQATGSHLHLEVHVGGIDGTKIDPVPWLAARGVTV
jgi:murein DD-endopeptidase MepM/ murein hydrolase activator NlpD